MSRGKEPRWVPRVAIEAVHLDQIREHGGLPGLRDEAALDAALHRAPTKWHYDEGVDYADLAAAYAFGVSSNHPFRDGNKRTAFLALMMFLGLNGWALTASEEDVVKTMISLAASRMSEEALASWVRGNTEKRG